MDGPAESVGVPGEDETAATAAPTYAQRLTTLESKRWKQRLGVQAPYRWNVRRLCEGFVLDVGCGTGRNLAHLHGQGVGVDHNPALVEAARAKCLTAFTHEEFARSEYAAPGRFDTLLLAHVVEHMPVDRAIALVGSYLEYLRSDGRVVLITPQEAGHRSDPTHVHFTDFATARHVAGSLGLRVESERSFPFPRVAGKVFRYNEFNVVCRRPAGG